MAPSWMAAAIACIFSLPAGWRSIHEIKYKP